MEAIGFIGVIGVILYIAFLLAIMGLWIYGFILFVKLARRGIKALDIYISEKNRKDI